MQLQFDKENFKSVYKLSGVARLSVERYRNRTQGNETRIEDALNATCAAVGEGIKIRWAVQPLLRRFRCSCWSRIEGDEATGRNIVLRALEVSVRQIAFSMQALRVQLSSTV